MNVSARMPSRLVMTIAFTITALLLGIIGAVAAGTGTVTPPPKIAFVTTNADIAPDALTVGPMAGRLGAPLFITNKEVLGESTKNALAGYGADLIIVAGGPNTVTDAVLTEIAAATGLQIKDAAAAPSNGIIRVFGDGRDETAVALSTLIAKYNPKFLPVDATAAGAVDADKLDGQDSSAFIGWPVETRSITTGLHVNTTTADFRDSAGFDQIRPTSSNTALFNVDLVVPPVPAGAAVKLTALELCYSVDNAADSITEVALFSFGNSDRYLSVYLNSTTSVCAPIDVGNGVPLGSASMSLYVRYSFGGTGSARDLTFYGARATWDLA